MLIPNDYILKTVNSVHCNGTYIVMCRTFACNVPSSNTVRYRGDRLVFLIETSREIERNPVTKRE